MGGKDKQAAKARKVERAKIKRQLAATRDQAGSIEREHMIKKLTMLFAFDKKK